MIGDNICNKTNLDEDLAWLELVGLCHWALLDDNRPAWKEQGRASKTMNGSTLQSIGLTLLGEMGNLLGLGDGEIELIEDRRCQSVSSSGSWGHDC